MADHHEGWELGARKEPGTGTELLFFVWSHSSNGCTKRPVHACIVTHINNLCWQDFQWASLHSFLLAPLEGLGLIHALHTSLGSEDFVANLSCAKLRSQVCTGQSMNCSDPYFVYICIYIYIYHIEGMVVGPT